MRRFNGWFPMFYVLFLSVNEGFADQVVKTFTIYNPTWNRCMKVIRASKRNVMLDHCQLDDDYFRWRWTTDGQIQNVATGFCIEMNEHVYRRAADNNLYAGLCNYRKNLQKWTCEHRFLQHRKFYYINQEHYRQFSRWRALRPHKVVVAYLWRSGKLSVFNDKAGANLCDFNHRDRCLQTVAKIPTTDDTCLIAVEKNSIGGYAEIKISLRKPLEDFSIFMWVKTRLYSDVGNIFFSYTVDNDFVLGIAHFEKNKTTIITLFDQEIRVEARTLVLFTKSYWVRVALVRSVWKGTLSYYVNDALMHKETSVGRRAIPGTGTLRLGRSVMKDLWFNGLISQFNIFDRVPHSQAEIEEHIQMQHCCHDKLPSGNWLNWDTIIKYWTLNGTARIDKGADCTNFEIMPSNWIEEEHNRQNCRTRLMVSHPRYIPDYHFSSSSWVPAGIPSNGRASNKRPNAWCPENSDANSHLQVDLGYVRKVTAIGTMLKLQERHAKRIKVYYSEKGIQWKHDGQVYEASQSLVPEVRIVPLDFPVMARYVRLYPTGCLPSRCCLAVEIYGCDPEIEQKSSEVEDGCTSPDKPYILMYLPKEQHITRIQVRARAKKRPIQSFYMYYMAWRQWIPYQVNGKTKVFTGNRDTSRPFTHILTLPIFTRFVKIFPIPYASSVCSDFIFIGCHMTRDHFCSKAEVGQYRTYCWFAYPRCELGFVGNGLVCQDLNECDVKTGAYCDRNSICKNKYGSFSCDPCKNNFIGDGRICQTSCEALGITCGANSFCDVDQCKCYEGFLYNGTHCNEDPDFGKEKETTTMRPDAIEGLCPDGFFNCYGDVVGVLKKLRNTALAFENFDYDECGG